MDRKSYMKNIYSKYWVIAREKKYGFLDYDKNLCNYILKNISIKKNILEVAVGTGFPFANFFQKKGFQVYGIDIAPSLVEKCKKLNNKIICKVGDAENLEYPDNFFGCTYCFHSTFYFSNIYKAINEMLRVTLPGGLIIFDIQNSENFETIKNYNKLILSKKKLLNRGIRYLKNIIKMIIKKEGIDWTNIIYETPENPENIINHLKKNKIYKYKLFVRLNDQNIKMIDKYDLLKNYSRVIFSITKT